MELSSVVPVLSARAPMDPLRAPMDLLRAPLDPLRAPMDPLRPPLDPLSTPPPSVPLFLGEPVGSTTSFSCEISQDGEVPIGAQDVLVFGTHSTSPLQGLKSP